MRSVGWTGDDWIRPDSMVRRALHMSWFVPTMRAIRKAITKPVNAHLIDVEPDHSIANYPPNDGNMNGMYR